MKDKKKLALIGSAAAALLIIMILFLVISGNSNEKKTVIESQNVIEEAKTEDETESRYVTEVEKERDLQGISCDISPSEAAVIPEIEMLTFEEASAQGEVREYADTLPGSDEGVWYLVTTGGVEYIYGKYDFDEKENYEFFSWALRDDSHQLANGLRVGMTKEEALEICPALISIDFEGTGWPAWNGTAYPDNWTEEFDGILVANIDNHNDELPVFLALMMKEGKIVAITQYEPTAG